MGKDNLLVISFGGLDGKGNQFTFAARCVFSDCSLDKHMRQRQQQL